MRTFLCIPVEPNIRKRIVSVANELQSRVDTYASWVQPANYHVTVRFLGEIDPMLTVDLKEACQGVAAQIPPFDISLDRVDGFPNLDRARVLWVGGEAPEAFRSLLTLIDSSLFTLGFPHARMESLAHITIARIKGRVHTPLSRSVAQVTQPAWVLHVKHLVLMESRLTPRGAIYSPLFTLPFSAGAHVGGESENGV